jgi:hypothetical protein
MIKMLFLQLRLIGLALPFSLTFFRIRALILRHNVSSIENPQAGAGGSRTPTYKGGLP